VALDDAPPAVADLVRQHSGLNLADAAKVTCASDSNDPASGITIGQVFYTY